MDFSVITNNLPYFLWGAWPNGTLGGVALTLIMSIAAALASGILGLALGILLAISRGRKRWGLLAFLGFFRAIPVVMLIFWTYFLLPIIFGIDVPGIGTVIVALTLVSSSYLAHSVHAGIASLPPGQWQAASALGLSQMDSLRHVILPQALPIMLPSFLNQWVTLVKDSSLAYVIGVSDLSFVATQISNREMIYPAEVFLFVALVYYVICSLLELLATSVMQRVTTRR